MIVIIIIIKNPISLLSRRMQDLNICPPHCNKNWFELSWKPISNKDLLACIGFCLTAAEDSIKQHVLKYTVTNCIGGKMKWWSVRVHPGPCRLGWGWDACRAGMERKGGNGEKLRAEEKGELLPTSPASCPCTGSPAEPQGMLAWAKPKDLNRGTIFCCQQLFFGLRNSTVSFAIWFCREKLTLVGQGWAPQGPEDVTSCHVQHCWSPHLDQVLTPTEDKKTVNALSSAVTDFFPPCYHNIRHICMISKTRYFGIREKKKTK